jgi:hypothetical protein
MVDPTPIVTPAVDATAVHTTTVHAMVHAATVDTVVHAATVVGIGRRRDQQTEQSKLLRSKACQSLNFLREVRLLYSLLGDEPHVNTLLSQQSG